MTQPDKKKFQVTYEIPPMRAIWTLDVEAVDLEDAMDEVYERVGTVRIRGIDEKQAGNHDPGA